MLDQQHRHTRIADAPDHLDGLLDVGGVEPRHHLVQQQDARPDRQRAGYLQTLHPAHGEAAGLDVQVLDQVGLLGHLQRDLFGLVAVRCTDERAQHDVL
ncbi:hypothetical protein D3C81_1879590 [compost metagenome]